MNMIPESLFCHWEEGDGVWQCRQCKAVVKRGEDSEKPFSACRVGAEKHGVPFRSMVRAVRVPDLPAPRRSIEGPGTELKKLIQKIGLRDRPGCACNSRAMLMNTWGPDVCENNLEQIVGWLRDEAKRRKLPFVDSLARILVRRAIAKARATERQSRQ